MFQDNRTTKAQRNVVEPEKFLDEAGNNIQNAKDNVLKKLIRK